MNKADKAALIYLLGIAMTAGVLTFAAWVDYRKAIKSSNARMEALKIIQADIEKMIQKRFDDQFLEIVIDEKLN